MTNIVRELPVNFQLLHGGHADFERGACLMEAVAYIAGEPHSDHPSCASRVLIAHGIQINDRLYNEERQLLAPLIPRLVGTRTDAAHDLRRAHVLADASIREIVPMALDAVKWHDLAHRLRCLDEITDKASAEAARLIAIEVREEGYKRKSAADAADADAAAYAAYAAAYAAYADADADASAADAASAAYAAADAASAAYADADADASASERAHIRSAARRPIILATIAAFERAIEVK